MIYRRERPVCRKAIEYLLKEYNCTLLELLRNKYCFLSDGLRKQVRKMCEEQGINWRVE